MVVFAEKMGLDLHHVPYKTTAQSIIDVATGIIHMQLASMPPIVSLYESKRIQVLGIAGKHRLPLMPDVPTMAEAGIPDYEQTFWLAVFAPAGTPAPIVTRAQPRDRGRAADRRGQECVHRARRRDRAQHPRGTRRNPAARHRRLSQGRIQGRDRAALGGNAVGY